MGQKLSFKNSVDKRCLVIANGYYEWQWLDPKGKAKQKYELRLPYE
jgi:putative SOS response-associated peptidase YedK